MFLGAVMFRLLLRPELGWVLGVKLHHVGIYGDVGFGFGFGVGVARDGGRVVCFSRW